MRYILEDFSHEKGLHSDTSALRDLFAYAGHGFPEPFFFGMGEGLGFSFHDGGNGKLPMITGRTGILEIDVRISRMIGSSLKVATSTSPGRAQELLVSMIREGRPVIMHVDAHYLRYLRSKAHFGAYSIVAAGVDEDAGIAHVADYNRHELIDLPLSELAAARASSHRPFPPRHRWFDYHIPAEIPVDKSLVMGAIGRNALEMLNSPVRNNGVGGIYFLANCMYHWKEKYGKDLGSVCRIVRDAIEGPGTGGGCFRNLYAGFLEYASHEIGIDELSDVADGYCRVSAMWSQASKLLSGIECGCSSVSETADYIKQIASKEHELQVSLLTTANLCCRRK